MHKNVWVLGSSNIDFTYRVKDLPLAGQTIQAESQVMATGGKGANQAIAAAHWGANVHFIGAVGDDANGKTLLEALTTRKVNIDHVYEICGVPSGNAVILVDDNGENSIIVYPGANQCVPVRACDQIHFREGDVLVSQLEVNLDAIECCFQRAKEQGGITVLNPSPYKPLLKRLLETTDIIVANTSEAFELGGVSVNDPQSARQCGQKILEAGPGTAIITMGEAGVVLVNYEKTIHFPGHKVHVVDGQGSGDAFLGTLLASLSQREIFEQAIAFANRVAAFSVTKRGSTQVSLPDQKEILVSDLTEYMPI